MKVFRSVLFYLFIVFIIGIIAILWVMNFHKPTSNISINFFALGNIESNGCVSVYVDDPDNNEYSFDEGKTWQKSKYGAIYQNGKTKILVRDQNNEIIEKKIINVSNISTDAPIIKLNFDSSVDNKTNKSLIKGVTAYYKNKDLLSNVVVDVIEEKDNKVLLSYLVEENDKMCYLVKEAENKNIKEEVVVVDKWVWPTNLSYNISRGISNTHKGVDIYGPKRGTAILAAKDGEVTEISKNYSSGFYVILKHSNGYYTRYAHMQNTNGNDKLTGTSSATKYIKVGQKVTAGTTIGEIGCTGNCTGLHIHFEVWNGVPYKGKVLNPLSFYTKGVNR